MDLNVEWALDGLTENSFIQSYDDFPVECSIGANSILHFSINPSHFMSYNFNRETDTQKKTFKAQFSTSDQFQIISGN